MSSNYVLKKKDIIQSVTTGFLPPVALVPLCQEKNVLCESVVQCGARVEEGQVIAEPKSEYSTMFDCAKIHSPIPGVVVGTKKCSYPNGKIGDAIEIQLSGRFTYIGKLAHEFDWKSWGKNSLLNRISANGVINTFSSREPCSLATTIREVMEKNTGDSKRLFVRLYDEDQFCQTDSVLAKSEFDKLFLATQILVEMFSPKEVVFAYPKSSLTFLTKLVELKNAHELPSVGNSSGSLDFQFVAVNEKKFPCGTKYDIANRYIKSEHLEMTEHALCDNSLFVDCETLMSLYNAVVCNIPATRIDVNVSGDCLKSSAVLRVCVGTSFRVLAQELGLMEGNIGKIIVNGYLNGFSVPSLDIPVTKYVKSVAFISQRDIADYSAGYCIGCGKCNASCPAHIYPDIIFSNLVNSVKVPSDYLRAALLCTECGLCNYVCPVKLPLFQSVKILKERQNG